MKFGCAELPGDKGNWGTEMENHCCLLSRKSGGNGMWKPWLLLAVTRGQKSLFIMSVFCIRSCRSCPGNRWHCWEMSLRKLLSSSGCFSEGSRVCRWWEAAQMFLPGRGFQLYYHQCRGGLIPTTNCLFFFFSWRCKQLIMAVINTLETRSNPRTLPTKSHFPESHGKFIALE